MNLILTRTTKNPDATIGVLTIDGQFECYTLEDTVRPPGVKVQNATAIPYGTYKVIIDMSTRFGKLMPHVLDVQGFSGIRIHSGNTSADTDGCILLGRTFDDHDVYESHAAFNAFFPQLEAALARHETVTIEIKDS